MPRPGITITRSTTRPAQSLRTGTGPWFIAGMTGTADADAGGVRKPMFSLAEYAARFGSRTAHGANPEMYDSAELYFNEGGSELYVSRTTDVTDAQLTIALDRFTADLGPGQVSAPARITAGQRLLLGTHGSTKNRIAIIASTNTNVLATLTADTAIAGASLDTDRVTMLVGPWVVVPGGGATRTVSPEAIVAGLMSRNDARGITPNQPSAGVLGVSITGIDVANSFTSADRATLNANGVNLFRSMYNGVRLYGYRTLADPVGDANFVNAANARLFMAIQAEVDAVAERFVFRQIDGQRFTINEFGGALIGVLLPYYRRGSLFGASAAEAFRVDVGPNVNTDATIANKELRANIALRMSEFAEEVTLDLVKVATLETV